MSLRMIRLCAASAVLLIAAAAGRAAPSGAGAFGVIVPALACANPQGPGRDCVWRDRDVARLAELGAGLVRVDFTWPGIQPRRPSRGDSGFEWRISDETVCSARRLGVDLFVSLMDTPPWAASIRNDRKAPAANMDDWSTFVSEVARRYDGHLRCDGGAAMRVDHFGIWNEPEHRDFFRGSRDQYDAIVRSARHAIKEANPSAMVLGPETGSLPWLQTSLSAIGDQFDIITVHWYPDYRSRLDDFLEIAHGAARGKPVWLTEVGERLCGRSEDQQDRSVRDSLDRFWARRDWLTKIFLYRLRDGAGESCPVLFGLVRQDQTPRPAFLTYQAFIRSHAQ